MQPSKTCRPAATISATSLATFLLTASLAIAKTYDLATDTTGRNAHVVDATQLAHPDNRATRNPRSLSPTASLLKVTSSRCPVTGSANQDLFSNPAEPEDFQLPGLRGGRRSPGLVEPGVVDDLLRVAAATR